jgi:VWFA-related protein
MMGLFVLLLEHIARSTKTSVLLMLGLLMYRVAFTDDLKKDQDKGFSLKVPVDLVIVPATVEDKDGKPLYDLRKEDFELREEGVVQDISYFSVDPFPLSVAILLDRSTDGRTQTALRDTLLSLVEVFSGFDEIALFQFENTVDKLQDFTFDKEKLLRAFKLLSLVERPPAVVGGPFARETTLNGIPIDSSGGTVQPPKTFNTHIDDAVFAASQELQRRGKNRRKIVILISDGRNAPGNRNSFESTIEAVLRTEILVYGIAQGSALVGRKFNTLTKYASQSGGSVFYPVKESGFSESYQRIAEMARNQYVLGFVSQRPAQEVTFRKLSVRVKERDADVKTRKGYYAVPRF